MPKTKHLLTTRIRVVMAGLRVNLTGAGAGLTAASTIGAAVVLVGCTGGSPVGLPAPDVVCPDAPPPEVLTAEQQARQNMVDVYLARRYADARWKILRTTKTCTGDVWDWLDPATVPGSEDEPPPPPEYTPPDDVEPVQTELEAHLELQGSPDGVGGMRSALLRRSSRYLLARVGIYRHGKRTIRVSGMGAIGIFPRAVLYRHRRGEPVARCAYTIGDIRSRLLHILGPSSWWPQL